MAGLIETGGVSNGASAIFQNVFYNRKKGVVRGVLKIGLTMIQTHAREYYYTCI